MVLLAAKRVNCAVALAAAQLACGRVEVTDRTPAEPTAPAPVKKMLFAEAGSSTLCAGGLAAGFSATTVPSRSDISSAFITGTGKTERIWYTGNRLDSPVTAALTRDSRVVEAPFESPFRLAVSGDAVGVVGSIWREIDVSDVVFALLTPEGRFTEPLLMPRDKLTDDGAEIASGPNGQFALVWNRHAPGWGPYSLELAIVDSRRVLVRKKLADEVLARGLSVLYTGSEYLVVYNPSAGGPNACTMPGTAPTAEQGLRTMRIGTDGRLIAESTILSGEAVVWSKAVWDGAGIAVAFSWNDRLVFVRLRSDGTAFGPPSVIAWVEDSEFEPSSISFSDGLYWVGATLRSMAGSVDSAPPPRAYLFAVEHDGKHTMPLLLPPGQRGSLEPVVQSSAMRARGVFRQGVTKEAGLVRTFEAICLHDRGQARSVPN